MGSGSLPSPQEEPGPSPCSLPPSLTLICTLCSSIRPWASISAREPANTLQRGGEGAQQVSGGCYIGSKRSIKSNPKLPSLVDAGLGPVRVAHHHEAMAHQDHLLQLVGLGGEERGGERCVRVEERGDP